MTYQVLARKWRPKDFASLVGQEHVVRALTHALDGGRLHHAYLFTGTRGVGKTTLSRIFAKALNCETGVTSTPCGVCRACREIDEGRFVDYVEMDAASNRGVDEMAALLERAVYAPVDARFKVYMIDEVHMLTNHAFNAMLKTLEEPPPHVKFILATTDPQKIPVTVLSRCLQFNLKQMPAGHIVSHLEHILGEENIPHEAQALRLLARAADGSMRDALSLTDQAIAYSANQVTEEAVRGMLGALDQSYLIRLLDALVAGEGAAVLSVADEMALRSLSFSTALQDLASLLHKIAWAQFSPSSVLDEWPEASDLRRFADTLSPEQVQLFYQIATIGRSELGLAPDEYAGFTMTLLRMLAFEPAPNGGGGGGVTPAGRSSVPAAGAKRTGAPVAAAAVAAAPQARTSDAPAAAVAIAPRVAPEAKPEPAPVQPQTAPDAAVSPAPAPEIQAAPVDALVTPLSVAAASTLAESPANVDSPVASIAQQDNAAPPDDFSTQAESTPRRAGGASAALDVLRNAGLKVSTGSRPASAAPASAAPSAPAKPAAPRVAVRVPTPDPARRAAAAAQQETAGRTQTPRAAQPQGASGVPPWDDVPPDDYMPASSDDAFFAASDDNFIPVFDSGPDDMLVGRRSAPAAPVATAAPGVDIRTLPPAVPLEAIGVDGDWPALAVTLPLKGIAYQLAFNSELMAVEGKTLKLNVAVQLYTESAQIAKLKAALAERLGSEIDVQVEVGPVRRTAAVLDSIERAKRQQEAEREIGADPFVQSLIREFGASIVPGSVRPLAPGAEGGQSAAGH
ncbi:DNA polymerase III subunits gamma and tau [Paraburkholderia hospita]|uniref:DNA polymerase III subunit gamma/tau n=1 Tax=Paraburkholderia hospita TaxID=169430 RepID=A0ABN0FGQ5_9BURK|nr:DNA polymerase III subunit gamma/tau [Paraburkholderia hospita]EIM97902.1 DNA polymerase III subunits gamma and tau [Paraburkholderia hospita]OUL90411.1 DNA polymerase III subunit gamma/tau [Paraburkholderia hospita]OUL90837.1 DNA polymerase III subunit gamma/tau [Paraburkholderia hospita]SKC77716.1 DNA polymerase-3 subunit gamma/tau [Burkholderia sp. CF099]